MTSVSEISGGFVHAIAAKADGTVWAWGGNSYGQIGDGTSIDRYAPAQSGFTAYSKDAVSRIAAGYYRTLGLKRDGTVWLWGYDYNCGIDYYLFSTTPVQVSGVSDVVEIAGGHNYNNIVLKADGTAWAWGCNSNGEVGDGTKTSRSTPVQVRGLTDVAAVSMGSFHTAALKADGTVWTWGYNNYGQLGDGTTVNKTTPVQVSGLTDVIAISAGGYHTAALKSDGTVWLWGLNISGTLGGYEETYTTTPVQVGGISGIVKIVSGTTHIMALKADGTVWGWGAGEFGTGAGSYNRPVQISELTGMVAIAAGISHGFAVKNDGTVWAWGSNSYGQIGDGTTNDRLTPVQVSGLTGMIAVAGNSEYHSVALKSDGTVWGWGSNAGGVLGDGTMISRYTPVQAIFYDNPPVMDYTPPLLYILSTETVSRTPAAFIVKVNCSTSDAGSGVKSLSYAVLDEYNMVSLSGTVTPPSSGYTFDFTVSLDPRVRPMDRNGRAYSIYVTAIDNAGNSASKFTVYKVFPPPRR